MKARQEQYQTFAKAYAHLMSLPLGGRRWSGQAGDFLGKSCGSSMDFQDHRDYVPGDDPRFINWSAYARAGNYVVKQYQEEVSPTVEVIFDISASMFLNKLKEKRSCELFYLITAIAQKSGARLIIHLISQDKLATISTEEFQEFDWVHHVSGFLKNKSTVSRSEQTNFFSERLSLNPGSLRLLISDLLMAGDPNSMIRPLVEQKGRLLCYVPYLEEESSPKWRGQYEFEDVESGARDAYKVNESLLEEYQSAYQRHFSLWETALRSSGSLMARVSADRALEDALSAEVFPKKLLEYAH